MINSLFALCILWFGNNRYELHYWWGHQTHTVYYMSIYMDGDDKEWPDLLLFGWEIKPI
jgi:hypothetical protein